MRRPLSSEIGKEHRFPGAALRFCFGDEIARLAPADRGPPGERGGPVQHRRHLEPQAGRGMGEGVHKRCDVWAVARRGDEKLARGAKRYEGVAIAHLPEADGAGSRISCPGDDHHILRQAQRGSGLLADCRHRRGAFMQRGKDSEGQIKRVQRRRAPAAPRFIQHPCPGGIDHIRACFACEPKADIVFRHHELLHGRDDLRLMPLQPQQFRRDKAWHAEHAILIRQRGMQPLQLRRLRHGPPVIVKDAGPQRVARTVQRHEPMHLA